MNFYVCYSVFDRKYAAGPYAAGDVFSHADDIRSYEGVSDVLISCDVPDGYATLSDKSGVV